MLNLFIAVIVNAVQAMHEEEHQDEIEAEKATQKEMLSRLTELQDEIRLLRANSNQ